MFYGLSTYRADGKAGRLDDRDDVGCRAGDGNHGDGERRERARSEGDGAAVR